MSHLALLVLLAATLALAAALARATASLRSLRTELDTAHQTQHTRDSHRTHLDTLKNDFVANIAHELRTPLTSIRGALGLLSAGVLVPVDPRAQSLFHIALSNTDRLIRLINDLLDFERISSGNAPLNLRRCSMRELARQAVETMTPQADAAHVRLHLVLAAPPDCLFFNAEPDRILQVLTNLLSNAIKFSPPASVVEIRVEAEPDTLRLRISDSGRGIPPEKLVSIFGRFEQVESADSSKKGGTGLGLAICRTIMQQHGGAIWAESNPGHEPGASFFITFPRTGRQRDALTPQPSLTAPGTILLCDTDPALRALVAATIQRHGYQVLEAPDVGHALSLAAAHRIDAVLLDLALPGPEGVAPIDWLRRQPATAALPLVVYSAPILTVEELPGTQPQDSATIPPSKIQPPDVEELVRGILQRLQTPKVEATT